MATKTANQNEQDTEDTEVPAAEATEDTEETTASENGEKKRTRSPMPFGRAFGLTVKFHNDLNGQRDTIVARLLEVINESADGETLDVHRSTRGEPNENLQTWLIAPYGYDWPESASKERGVRLPQGTLSEALRRFAAKNDVTMEKAAEMFAEAFGISAETVDSKS